MAPASWLINGNALHLPLANESVHCAITSIPYWGLRDYQLKPTVWGGDPKCRHKWGGVKRMFKNSAPRDHAGKNGWSNTRGTEPSRKHTTLRASQGKFCQKCSAWLGQLGLEPAPALYIEHVVMVFREVWRVLRPDGTLWLNIGDSYARNGGEPGGGNRQVMHMEGKQKRMTSIPSGCGLKPKDLVGMPWRLAFALQDSGWHIRLDIIWHKPNTFPESVTDRPTKAHEYVFLLSKRQRYYYDRHAILEPQTGNTHSRGHGDSPKGRLGEHGNRSNTSFNTSLAQYVNVPGGRNKRSVWTVNTAKYHGAHFATFPEKLVEPMILAGTSAKGCCPECGTPYKRVTKKIKGDSPPSYNGSSFKRGKSAAPREALATVGDVPRTIEEITIGWKPGCHCDAGDPVPCTVLDNFAGTATVGRVSIKHGRRFVGVELGSHYLDLAKSRTETVQMAFAQ